MRGSHNHLRLMLPRRSHDSCDGLIEMTSGTRASFRPHVNDEPPVDVMRHRSAATRPLFTVYSLVPMRSMRASKSSLARQKTFDGCDPARRVVTAEA